MNDRDITNKKLCEDLGFNAATWSNRKRNPKSLQLSEIQAICNYLCISLADLEIKKL